ncbi:MAG: hypothetical protein Q8M31_03735 [Beijerinckiaceae bacterium]|nr:hypothetical protein [Beijerinckiaceae bacterium]
MSNFSRRANDLEGDMRTGQRVRLKALPKVAEALKLNTQTMGTVLCIYEVGKRSCARSVLLDVRLDSQVTLWGVAAEAFEDSVGGQSQSSSVSS